MSLPDNQKINVYTADRRMDGRGDISEDGECRGLHYMGDNRLVVSYWQPVP